MSVPRASVLRHGKWFPVSALVVRAEEGHQERQANGAGR